MKISCFDLYGNEHTNKHGIHIYEGVFFDGKNICYKHLETQNLDTHGLTKALNESDYKICHNFFGYDSQRLPTLNSHSLQNIDTLLIDSLLSCDQKHHNLKKSVDNTPLEDAGTTFEILEKNMRIFHNLRSTIQNTLYTLLRDNYKYSEFFRLYNTLSNNTLSFLRETEIFDSIESLLRLDNGTIGKSSELLEKYIKSGKSVDRLALSYLIIFLYKKKAVLPDFIHNSSLELRQALRGILYPFYHQISLGYKQNTTKYLIELTGYKNFRGENQTKGVRYSLENRDFLSILSTGGGKSLIYQLPAWIVGTLLGHLTLVITPLKALIKDQIDGLRKNGFNEVNYLGGDQNSLEKNIIHNKVKSGETKILFLTPEALRSESILELLQNRYINRVVIDEAHTLILWGQEFRPDYFFIKYFIKDIENLNLNKHISLTLLTATATVDVEEGIINYFSDREIISIKSPEILKKNIHGSVIQIENKNDKLEILTTKIKQINIEKYPTIIFTGRVASAIEIQKHLETEGIHICSFYAEMMLHEKKQVQEDFIAGRLNIIVATKAFGMGIDKENVRYVVHYDLPSNIEDYTQEIGRAGRDGDSSQNIILYENKEMEKRIKNEQFSGLKYYYIINFLKRVSIKTGNKNTILSPRQIAIMSGIKTNKKNWTTEVKILLSFLENEKFNGVNILNRRYDSTFVLFNKIENKILNDCYQKIMGDEFLNNQEKNVAKVLVKKVVEEKRALDLNTLEDNFKEYLGEDFNYKTVHLNRVGNTIKNLKILSSSDEISDSDIVIEVGNIKEVSYRNNIFKIYGNRIKEIDTYEEKKDAGFLTLLKNYYLFKNMISECKGDIGRINIKIKNKAVLQEHFNLHAEYGKIILDYIYDDYSDLETKRTINLIELLSYIQKNHKNNFTMSELKESLYFLHSLGILKVKNGLLVFLTRFSIFFDKFITSDIENFKSIIETESFKQEVIQKLEVYKQVKINKLQAIQNMVEVLERKGEQEYTRLTEYYFNTSLQKFIEDTAGIKEQ